MEISDLSNYFVEAMEQFFQAHDALTLDEFVTYVFIHSQVKEERAEFIMDGEIRLVSIPYSNFMGKLKCRKNTLINSLKLLEEVGYIKIIKKDSPLRNFYGVSK